MSLLTFAPDVVRLRRVAKACQAGELSRLEYRQNRREVIRKFVDGVEGINEDTIPRFDLEATLRRGFVAPVRKPRQRPNKLVWTCVVVAVLAGLSSWASWALV